MSQSAHFPDLEARSVLITGGGSGIGAALVQGFCGQAARVAFVDIDGEASRSLVERVEGETGNRPLFLNADLRDVDAIRHAAGQAAAAHGSVSVLVNNAARDDRHSVEELTQQDWDANQAINLRPHFFAIQAVVEGMKAARHGSIVSFTSTSFMISHGGFPAYTAAKAGIVGLTKGLAGALGPHGIRVNAIAPGWVMTERQRTLWVTPEALKTQIDRQCLKREIEPRDMVGPCLFLASEASAMMTSQVLVVDGGHL